MFIQFLRMPQIFKCSVFLKDEPAKKKQLLQWCSDNLTPPSLGSLPHPGADSPGETGRASKLWYCGETHLCLPERPGPAVQEAQGGDKREVRLWMERCWMGRGTCPFWIISFYYFEVYCDHRYVRQRRDIQQDFTQVKENLQQLVHLL